MANLNLNEVIIAGRMTADAELKTTQSGISVTTFTVAVNRPAKQGEEQKADFFTVTAWRQTAEFISKYFRKGASICLRGSLQTRTWEKDGVKHYATEILCDKAFFVDSRSESQQTTPSQQEQGTYIPDAYKQTQAVNTDMKTLSEDDELPF